MKLKLWVCTVSALLCAVLFTVPVLATEKGTRAAAIANTLERYQVSADWQPDITSNYVLLDELYKLVNSFQQEDVQEMGSKYESIKKYYVAYCKAKGINSTIPQVLTTPPTATVSPSAGSARVQANDILLSLVNGGVDRGVEGDIAMNSSSIEAMLLLVYDYTDAEMDAANDKERQSMLTFFVALYKYRGWDVTELDLLFTKSLKPIEGVVLAPAVPERMTRPIINQNPITPPISDTQDINIPTQHQSNDFLSGFVALVLWLGLLAGLVLFLKQRADNHHRT